MAESYRIAIADDEPVVVAFVRECLVRAGHSVVAEARSGEQLVQLCTTVVPDLIITDIKMGETDGITAVETILATHDLPVVVLSYTRRSAGMFFASHAASASFSVSRLVLA